MPGADPKECWRRISVRSRSGDMWGLVGILLPGTRGVRPSHSRISCSLVFETRVRSVNRLFEVCNPSSVRTGIRHRQSPDAEAVSESWTGHACILLNKILSLHSKLDSMAPTSSESILSPHSAHCHSCQSRFTVNGVVTCVTRACFLVPTCSVTSVPCACLLVPTCSHIS